MSKTLKKPGYWKNYDSAFLNPCIDKVLEGMEQVLNGFNVLLVFEDNLNRYDSYQVTQSFPLSFLQLSVYAKKHKLWNKLFLLCPHLIQPMKIVYCHSNRLKNLAWISDLLYKNQFNEKSEHINTETSSKYPFLKESYIEGIIFQEYKINISRLFIELLKYFEQLGGKVLVRKSFDPAEVKTMIHCNVTKYSSYILPVQVPSNLGLVYKYDRHIIRFLELRNLIQITGVNKSFKKLTTNDVERISGEFFHFSGEKIFKQDSESLLSIKTIETIVKLIKTPLPGAIKNATVKDNYELGLEKFDIAKQTGIDYSAFKVLFHRYGSGIDEMIELAYEKMNKIRDPLKIWDMVENEFHVRNEWKVS